MINLDAATDATLVVAIGRWHEPALAEAYRRHGGAVHAVAQRVLGSLQTAEDVTQEVFLRLWQHPERYDATRGTLRGYLLSVAHSRAVDAVRSQTARQAREQRGAGEVANGGYDIEHHAWDLHVGDQVRRAVNCLPDEERKAIEMAYFGGHTYREVARMLGAPEGTVKSRIRTGLVRLRQALLKEGAQL